MTSLQNSENTVILGAQGVMLMGSIYLIKMTRPRNIKMKEQCFAAWSSVFIKKFDPISIRRPKIKMFCSEIMKSSYQK